MSAPAAEATSSLTLVPTPEAPAVTGPVRARGRLVLLGAVLLVWIVARILLGGRDTLSLAPAELTSLHNQLNDARDWVDANRNSSPVFLYVFNEIRVVLEGLTQFFRGLIAVPAEGALIPVMGWLGVVAVFTFLAGWLGNLRVAALTAAGLVFVGLQGLWEPAMDTLAVTAAAVLVALLFGIPLGVWAGLSRRFERAITPVLDFMQTMPPFVYLAPLALFFGIGLASAVITTLIFAAPPVIRLTAYGIRSVQPATVEASASMGATRWQTLRNVLLPMSRRTIVLGVNQTIMAALSMVTIAALIDGPGLGKNVIKALQSVDVGSAFNAGLALVVLAIVLDRTTTAMAVRGERRPGTAGRAAWAVALERQRRLVVLTAAAVTAFVVYLSRTYLWAATFPDVGGTPWDLGRLIRAGADSFTTWVQDTFPALSSTLLDVVTTWVINPLQTLLVDSPWWITSLALLAIGWIAGRWRAVVPTVICLGLIIATGLWQDSMTTLASSLVATVVVMLLGVTFGVWMGRSRRADAAIRPVLDAAQVLPPFVYLVPVVALFAASRFSAIVAAVIYAAPVAIKIIADGIRGVSATTVEAAVAAGSTPGQVVRKVQLPMATPALVLATNQGLIFVLSMVVMGGLVGAGALGYDVVAGFSQAQLFGKGLAAGLAIVLLGIMLDRITQAAAGRSRRSG